MSSLIAIATDGQDRREHEQPERREATMSNARLSVRTLRESRIGGRLTIGMPSRSSIVALDANSSE